MQSTRKFSPLKVLPSTQIQSILSVSRSVHHFHFKLLDKYIPFPPPSPVIRFLWINLSPKIWNSLKFTEAMCVSDKVMINVLFVSKVSNISFLLSKPLMFWWMSLIPFSCNISAKFSWTYSPGHDSISPHTRSNKNNKLFLGNFATFISNKPKFFSPNKHNHKLLLYLFHKFFV